MTGPGCDGGLLVRPYAITGGRTHPPCGAGLPAGTLVAAADPDTRPRLLPPEAVAMVELCRGQQMPITALAARLGLPVTVVRVLLGDLIERDLLVAAVPPGGPAGARTRTGASGAALRDSGERPERAG